MAQRLERLVLRLEDLRRLRERQVVHGGRRHIRVVVLRVFHDADDLELRLQLAFDAEMLTDRLPMEVAIGKDLIHDRDFASMIIVVIGEEAARMQLGADCIEVFRTDTDIARLHTSRYPASDQADRE